MTKKPDKDFYDIVGKVEAAISLLPMPDLIHDKKVGALVAELKYKVNEFVNKRKCWWCGSKVKISKLSNEQKLFSILVLSVPNAKTIIQT